MLCLVNKNVKFFLIFSNMAHQDVLHEVQRYAIFKYANMNKIEELHHG